MTRVVDLRRLRYFLVVADERHIGRAAERLRMTQPPLSRAITQLEQEVGEPLLLRTPRGVELTATGQLDRDGARDLLAHADRFEQNVQRATQRGRLTVGSLADTVDLVGARVLAAFRQRHPDVAVSVHEADLGDPSAGLRSGVADIALTRLPFDVTGLRTLVLYEEPVGLVVRDDDPLADRAVVRLTELGDLHWVRLPPWTDATWTAYWTCASGSDPTDPPMHTIQECLHAVLWDGRAALAPLDQVLPAGLRTIPVVDCAPSQLALVWPETSTSARLRPFIELARQATRRVPQTP